ncbi:MAG: glycosyltransferase family 2 protein [Candidatus Dormibacteria bacterium]
MIGRQAAALWVSLGITLAEALRRRTLARLPELEPVPADEPAALTIDVVVPARDEAATIGRCAAALRRSTGVGRVLVVDDGSADATAALAAAAGAEVTRLSGPPPGWMGKPNACAAGAALSSATWLAFVDADVDLHPAALSALVEHCRRSGAVAASPLLRQRCTLLGDGLLVPLAWWQYLVGLPGAGRLLNGQCIVISAAAYRSCGGHGHPRVRGSVVEDAALGALLADRGGRPVLLRAGWAGEVRMYRGLREARAGFAKNLAGFLAGSPGRGALVAGAGVAVSAPLSLVLSGVRQRSPRAVAAALLPWALAAVLLRPRYAEASVPPALAWAAPPTAALLQLIALESLLRRILGRPPAWRGRPARAAR